MVNQSDAQPSESRGLFERFIRSESLGSIVLLLGTLAALFWANSPWSDSYLHLLHTKIGFVWGEARFNLPLHYWINDGLMVIFFFVVGLEIKRELLIGHLSVKKAVLPVMAALGGMIFPALIYAALNIGRDGARGWGIPMATDIAFSLGVLSILGKRVPIALRSLTAVAIADDLGAVVVIAIFYTEKINFAALAIALVLLGILYATSRIFGVRRMGILLLLVLGVWIAVFVSGIHATVAGILVALVVPVAPTIEPESFLALARDRLARLNASQLTPESIHHDEKVKEAVTDLELASRRLQSTGLRFEHYLHPVQAFFILPLFAWANAGVILDQGLLRAAITPEGLGVVLGLCIGKPVGFLLLSWLAVRSGYANLPEGVNWRQLCGIGCLAGIGFTMSLFVTELAFSDDTLIANSKAAILSASCVSTVMGYVFSAICYRPRIK